MTPYRLRKSLAQRFGLASVWLLIGCANDTSDATPDDDTSTTTGSGAYAYYEDTRSPPSNDLVWSRCSLTTSEGVVEGVAECASAEVPARRDTSGSATLTLSVKRYRPVAAPRGQLWLINGGPGASSGDFEPSIDLFTAVGRDLEVYLLDHRGTGSSSALHCPEQEAATSESGASIFGDEWGACAAALTETWGDALNGFSVTEAATDIGELIDRTRHGSEAVFLYTVSYGTYLAQRYLQLFPSQATGVVLDSICSPGSCQILLKYDQAFDATTRSVLSRCAEDPTCSAQLGADPYARLVAVANSLDSAHCTDLGWTRANLRNVLGLMVTSVILRDYMPAVIRRVERCSANDVASLKLFQNLISSMGSSDSSYSPALLAHIALAELSEDPLPTEADITANVERLYASIDTGPQLAGAIDTWPIYPTDDLFGQFANTAIPLLMLNGDLDPQTPLDGARPTFEHFTGEYQRAFKIPNAAHTTLTQSPVDAERHTCGAELARQFLDDPTAALDDSCLELVLPLSFSGDTDVSELLFGTASPWEDTAPTSTAEFSPGRLRTLRMPLRNLRGLTPL